MDKINQHDILEIIKSMPHQYPFLLIDRILQADDKQIMALKNVTFNEPFFPGHLPQMPVMPGVLIIETLAQTCGYFLYLNKIAQAKELFYLAAVSEAKFKKPVIPGDQLFLHAYFQKNKMNVCYFEAEATVENQVVCQAKITLAKK